MMSFLTVEDVNGTLLKYGDIGVLYELNTSNITDTDVDYTDVQYDFVKVSRIKSGSTYTFTFEVVNSAWNGKYAFFHTNRVYIYAGSYQNSKITIDGNFKDVILMLYCNHINTTFSAGQIQTIPSTFNQNVKKTLEYYPHTEYIEKYVLTTGYTTYGQITRKPGVFDFYGSGSDMHSYYVGRLLKTDFTFNCNQNLTIGKVNTIQLGTGTKYKPGGALVGNYTTNISVSYNEEVIDVSWDSGVNDYVFNLDLTNIAEPGKVKFKVIVEGNEVLNHTEIEIGLDADYETITTFNNLKSALEGDVVIIKLGANLTASSSVTISHDVLILGNSKSINLNGYNITVNGGIHANIQDLSLTGGDTSILQKETSTLEMTNCTFTNATSTSYNGLGSCICCDLDYESLENPNDFTTILTDCTFTNNHNCILHGGELTVTNCRYHNTDLTYVDTGNPAFLYQSDGTAIITSSIFDIDYTATTLCSNNKNIGYAQALIIFGEDAVINNQTSTEVQDNNLLAFFDQPYNNQSHIYAKYYYPQISSCVYTSPVPNRENKCIAWAVSGVDWVFKTNLQITTSNPNETRKITW